MESVRVIAAALVLSLPLALSIINSHRRCVDTTSRQQNESWTRGG